MKIPSSKYNPEEFEIIRNSTDEEIIKNCRNLLPWVQDINWPIAHEIVLRLKNVVPEIESEIMEVLNGDDHDWKINVLRSIVKTSSNPIPASIRNYILQLLNGDLNYEDELIEVCDEVFIVKIK